MKSDPNMIIGYTAGTFDMFHIGHLNLFIGAKKYCDYLIVGVNQDELVEEYKNKSVIVPFDERIKIVQSIKYVDETIGVENLDKKPYWEKLRFNKLFIGSDWRGNPRWDKTKSEMEAVGVELIYLPYTQSTSSTALREKLMATIPF